MWNESDIPDLGGKVALVTGGNTGIGFQTVKQLALHGAKVYMAARSKSRAEKAIGDILSEHPSIIEGCIVWLQLDLSKLSSVNEAVKELYERENRLDILINNAGIAAEDFRTTEEGFELTMAVNYIGHFVLTTKLLPLLRSTASKPGSDVRVVTLSSSAESMAPSGNGFASPEDLNDPCAKPSSYKSRGALFKRYGASKLACILFTRELQRQMDKEKSEIMALSLNPGGVATEGGIGVWPGFLRPIMRIMFTTPQKGALTPLFCATAAEIAKEKKRFKGQFLNGPGKIAPGSERSRDVELARTLWETTEKQLKVAGVS
ncbi:hypothetical protein GGI35DRAFT_486577 [Trichoderma velutinum]